jgi:hypothetical protein
MAGAANVVVPAASASAMGFSADHAFEGRRPSPMRTPHALGCKVVTSAPVTTSEKSPPSWHTAAPVRDATLPERLQFVPLTAHVPPARRSDFSVVELPSE